MLRLQEIVPINDELNNRSRMLSKVYSEILFLKVYLDYDVSDLIIFA